MTGEKKEMAQCVTCGSELHPERAKKYNYCMARECQEKNAKGLTMVAVGVNKAADQFLILDQQTREELASGKYHDQRRGSFGAPASRPAPPAVPPAGPAAGHARRVAPRRPAAGTGHSPGRPAKWPATRGASRRKGWRSCTTSREYGLTK